jgi:hypothetical protein
LSHVGPEASVCGRAPKVLSQLVQGHCEVVEIVILDKTRDFNLKNISFNLKGLPQIQTKKIKNIKELFLGE